MSDLTDNGCLRLQDGDWRRIIGTEETGKFPAGVPRRSKSLEMHTETGAKFFHMFRKIHCSRDTGLSAQEKARAR